MGAWGEGIFENDNAMDFLGDFIDEFEDSFESYFSEPIEDDIDFSINYEGSVGPLITLLNVICKNTPASPPEPEKITKWKQMFFKEFDKYTVESWGKESSGIRKKLFEKEFDELISYSKEYYKD